MLKSFGLVDNIWFDKSVIFPTRLTDKYIIHDLYGGNFTFKQQLREWEYPIITLLEDTPTS